MARPETITISFSGDSSEYILTLSNETATSWEYTYGNPGTFDGVGVYISSDAGWEIDVVEYNDLSFYPPDPVLFYASSVGLAGWDENPWTGTSEPDNESDSESSIGGTATISFEPMPGKPINPTPVDEASDVTLDATTVTWEDGGGATSYNVYYGTLSGFLTLLESGVTDLEYTLVSGNWPRYNDIFYWRIDAVNEYGTTQGDEWYFSTIRFYPPLPTGITLDEDGNPTGTPNGENNIVTIRRLIAASNNKIWFEDI